MEVTTRNRIIWWTSCWLTPRNNYVNWFSLTGGVTVIINSTAVQQEYVAVIIFRACHNSKENRKKMCVRMWSKLPKVTTVCFILIAICVYQFSSLIVIEGCALMKTTTKNHQKDIKLGTNKSVLKILFQCVNLVLYIAFVLKDCSSTFVFKDFFKLPPPPSPKWVQTFYSCPCWWVFFSLGTDCLSDICDKDFCTNLQVSWLKILQ